MWSEKKWGHVWINAGHRFYQKAILNESLLVDHKKSEIKLLLTRLRISGMTTALRPILYPPDNYDNDNLICLTFIIIISSSLLTTALRPLLHPSGQSIVKVLAHSLASGIANIAKGMVWKWRCFFFLLYMAIILFELKGGEHSNKYFEQIFPTETFCLKCLWMQRKKLPIMVVR